MTKDQALAYLRTLGLDQNEMVLGIDHRRVTGPRNIMFFKAPRWWWYATLHFGWWS